MLRKIIVNTYWALMLVMLAVHFWLTLGRIQRLEKYAKHLSTQKTLLIEKDEKYYRCKKVGIWN